MNRAAGNRLPTYQRERDDVRKEIAKLWQALSKRQPFPAVQGAIPFSWRGTVSGTRTSGPFHAPGRITITSATLGYRVAGGATTAALLIDGVTVHTFSLGAGAVRSAELVRFAVAFGDPVQITVAGGGGSDFTCVLGYVWEAGTL